MKSGIGEFDRVTGGGLVPGSAILIGGDPGIGKSTILLQVMSKLADNNIKTVYISGEESVAQVRMRAKRLGLAESDVSLGSETNLRDILATLSKGDCPNVVVIDSIQTMYADTIESAPGTVAQVRTSAQELIRFAEENEMFACCSSAMSPKTVKSQDHALWNIWLILSFILKGTAVISFVFYAQLKTVLAVLMKLVYLKWVNSAFPKFLTRPHYSLVTATKASLVPPFCRYGRVPPHAR